MTFDDAASGSFELSIHNLLKQMIVLIFHSLHVVQYNAICNSV